MPIEAVRKISFSPSVIGARERAAHRLGEGGDALRLALRDEQEGELVAGKPRQRVLRLEQAGEAPRDGEQDRVADRDAEAVVDLLEAVDVEDEDRRPRRAFGLGAGDRRAQPVEEQLAVGQAGQVVVDGVVQQPLLGLPLLGHVEQRADAAQHLAVGAEHRPGAQVEPAVVAVLASAGGNPGRCARGGARPPCRASCGSGRGRRDGGPPASRAPGPPACRAAGRAGPRPPGRCRCGRAPRPSPRRCRRRRSAPAPCARCRRSAPARRRRRRRRAA